jgi:hypothetical protein
MAGYDKFRNHMQEPEQGIISEEDKTLICNVATAGIIGIGAVTVGPTAAAIGCCLWATDMIRRRNT